MRFDTRGKKKQLAGSAICILGFLGAAVSPMAMAADASGQKSGRKIEEVVVTAEKVKSTVSDTAISITAFNTQMISDYGMQNADDMVNFIPATTRDAYDIRIRGVGKNFRALGGDPGVATYYNGVFSPDFGIAAGENALWDLSRVEVLRGPQGTLYGRNAIGGAINYVTKDPTWDWTGKARVQLGDRNDREVYGMVSGPLVQDKLAMRFVAVKRLKDGNIDGLNGSQDTDSADDRNYSLSLTWDISDTITLKTRANDRLSDRIIQSPVLINAGAGSARGDITSYYAYGLHPVSAGAPGAMAFTDPATGATVYGAYVRPGVDIASDFEPNGAYMQSASNALMAGASVGDPNNANITNNDGTGPCKFPYTLRNCNNERFEHNANQTDITWDINGTMSLKYIFGYTDYKYSYNIDEDFSNAGFDKNRLTVLEDVQQKSHELQLQWALGDRFTATSGAFWYDEIRQQDYSITDTVPRFTDAVDYGALAAPTPAAFGLGGASLINILQAYTPGGISSNHVRLGDAPLGNRTALGLWEGDVRGDRYHHFNTMHNISTAFYTQGTYVFNDEWDLVVGLRYAKDKKEATEIRTGYTELSSAILGAPTSAGGFGLNGLLAGLDGGIPVDPSTGLTTLGAINVAMGNALYTGDVNNPLQPTCALTATSCSHPLRLQGVPLSFSGYIKDHDSWDDLNYRVNLDWSPNGNTLMYFSVTTGYRAGGYALGVVAQGAKDANGNDKPAKFDAETVTSFEVGYKGKLIDNTLQLNASLYHYIYKNYQDEIDAFDPVTSSVGNMVVNAPRATNTGFEVEALWLATDNVTVGGNYSYTKTKYDGDYVVNVLTDPNLPIGVLAPYGAGTRPDIYQQNLNGNDLKKIPRNKATLWGSYYLPTAVGDFTMRATWSYTGGFWDQGYQNSVDRVPSRQRVDLSATWEDPALKWKVRVFCDNVTDERAIRELTESPNTRNFSLSGTILAPRFFGISTTYTFAQ